jgi:hypothetical protein
MRRFPTRRGVLGKREQPASRVGQGAADDRAQRPCECLLDKPGQRPGKLLQRRRERRVALGGDQVVPAGRVGEERRGRKRREREVQIGARPESAVDSTIPAESTRMAVPLTDRHDENASGGPQAAFAPRLRARARGWRLRREGPRGSKPRGLIGS